MMCESLCRQGISSHDIDCVDLSLAYMGMDFKYLCHIDVEEWHRIFI